MTPQLISRCRERPEAEPKDKREAIRLRNRRAIVAAAGELTAELGTEGVSVNDLGELRDEGGGIVADLGGQRTGCQRLRRVYERSSHALILTQHPRH